MENCGCNVYNRCYCVVREIYPAKRIASMNLPVVMVRPRVINEKELEYLCDDCKDNCIGKEIISRNHTERQIWQMMSIAEHWRYLNSISDEYISFDDAGVDYVRNGLARTHTVEPIRKTGTGV